MSLCRPRPRAGTGRAAALAGPAEATPAQGAAEQNGGQEPDSSQSVGQFAASKPLAMMRGSDNKEQDAATSPTSSRSRGKERKVLSGLTIQPIYRWRPTKSTVSIRSPPPLTVRSANQP